MQPRDILFVSHPQQQCGVYQFGRNIAKALGGSTVYHFVYRECANPAELQAAAAELAPAVIIYNYYASTMPWLNRRTMPSPRVPQVGILHEVTQAVADRADNTLFDYHVAPDPTLLLNNRIVFKTGRLLLPYTGHFPEPEIPTIGCFGFGTEGKGFDRVISGTQEEYDRAVIRLHMPFATFGDADGQRATAYAQRCREMVTKPGIELKISHDFLSTDQLLDFLAANTINAFFYDQTEARGISSVLDHALAVHRPIAINRSNMFRHLFGARPSVCIEDSSLRQIVANGTKPLQPFYEEWSAKTLVWDYERIMNGILSRPLAPAREKGWREGPLGKLARKVKRRLGFGQASQAAVTGDKQMRPGAIPIGEEPATTGDSSAVYTGETLAPGPLNRILDDAARERYAPAIAALFRHAPQLMARKIARANVQQGFMFDTVLKLISQHPAPKVLCVGGYEDSAAASLKAVGLQFEDIDPAVNYDLDAFLTKPSTVAGSYQIVFSTSVIEHVEDDERFVRQIASLLAPGGAAVLTCDYNDQYLPGDPVPAEDFRFYTQRDLRERLMKSLTDCSLADEPQWDCPAPDFTYAGCRYTFATLVFRKNP